jgi:hypothetical protein
MKPVEMAFITRLMSVVVCVLGVVLLYQLARRAAQAQTAGWAGAVAATFGAFSPFWLAESQETRMYTVGFALLSSAAVALLIAWQRIMADGEAGEIAVARVPLVCFVILSGLALVTHYNAVFIEAAWYLAWFAWGIFQRQRWRLLAVMLACGIATVILILPVAPIALRQIPNYANPNLIVPTVESYLVQNWQAYWGGYAFEPALAFGWGVVWLWVAVALVIGGVILAWLAAEKKLPLAFLLVWVFGGLALYYIAVWDRGAFEVRYSSFITPPLYALAGVALVAWGQVWRPLAVVAVIAALLVWPQAVYADLYNDKFARENISGVTDWLRRHADADSVVFVDQKYPFGFYYDRYTIDPSITPPGDEAAPARYLFVDINTIDQRLQEWAANAKHVYWVQWFQSDTDPRRAVTFLLDQAGKRGDEKDFRGYTIEQWQLTPPNAFVLAPNMKPLEVNFPPAVQTIEASLPVTPVLAGGYVPVVIRWQRLAGGEITRPLKARVALYNRDGGRVSQKDERMLNDRHVLPSQWKAEDHPLNVYLLDVPENLPPGHYTIGLLVYDADTLEPLGVTDSAGNANGVEATIGSVEIVQGKP